MALPAFITNAIGSGFSSGISGAITGGISNLFGSLFGGDDDGAMEAKSMQYELFDKANKFTRNERLFTQKWLKEMADTAHQREAADMAKAGINRILTGKYGGAVTPGISPGHSTSIPHISSQSDIRNSATAEKMANLSAAKLDAEIELIRSEADRNRAESGRSTAETTELTFKQQERLTEEYRQLLDRGTELSKNIEGKIHDNHIKEQAEKLFREVTLPSGQLDVAKSQYLLEQIEMEMKFLRGPFGQMTKNLEVFGKANTGLSAAAKAGAFAAGITIGSATVLGKIWKMASGAGGSKVIQDKISDLFKNAPPKTRDYLSRYMDLRELKKLLGD